MEKTELGIITNGPSGHQWNKSEKPSGGEVGPSREYLRIRGCGGRETGEEDFWTARSRRWGLEDTEIWFVGDAYALDVVGALNAGWERGVDEPETETKAKMRGERDRGEWSAWRRKRNWMDLSGDFWGDALNGERNE